jgi:hypothetical protein
MAISLADIKRSVSGPPRLVTYGVPGIGKSTFAAMAPSPIFVPVEDGAGDLTDYEGAPLNVPAFPKPASYGDVRDCIASLVNEQHDFQTFVLDSLDKLEPLLWDFVCKRDGKESIEAYGYGKGYTAAAMEWRNFLDGCEAMRARGMTIILIEHVMRAVMALAARVLVLHHGAVIATGAPEAIVRHPEVMRSYLGTEALG